MVLSTDGHLVCIRSFWMFFMFSPLGFWEERRRDVCQRHPDGHDFEPEADFLLLCRETWSEACEWQYFGNTFQPGQLRSKTEGCFFERKLTWEKTFQVCLEKQGLVTKPFFVSFKSWTEKRNVKKIGETKNNYTCENLKQKWDANIWRVRLQQEWLLNVSPIKKPNKHKPQDSLSTNLSWPQQTFLPWEVSLIWWWTKGPCCHVGR